jgi:large subunit ribosomal protein LP1
MAFGDDMTEAAKGDAAVSFAVLALFDGGVAVTSENITATLKAANVNIAGYWAPLFAKMLAGRNVEDLLMKPGAGGGAAPAAGGAPAAGAPAAGKAAEKKEEKKEEEEEDAGGGEFFAASPHARARARTTLACAPPPLRSPRLLMRSPLQPVASSAATTTGNHRLYCALLDARSSGWVQHDLLCAQGCYDPNVTPPRPRRPAPRGPRRPPRSSQPAPASSPSRCK